MTMTKRLTTGYTNAWVRKKKKPAADFYKIYSSIFTPENTFFCHIDANDIEWMKNDPQTKMLFNSERAKKLAAKLLGFMEDVH